MKWNVSAIPSVVYGYNHQGKFYSCEPSREEIQKAVDNGELEVRGFQTHYEELKADWLAKAKSQQECDDLVRVYHSRRIAHFVVNGWNDSIILSEDGKMRDGLHRLKAAIFLGLKEVDAEIVK